MVYDYVIVGAGLTGAVLARELTDTGKHVLVIDRRSHIAGNCYTEQQLGIHVHIYGAHLFHTNNKQVWDYVNRFAVFNQHNHKVVVSCNDSLYSFPINLMTLHQLWGVSTPFEAEQRLAQVRLPIPNPRNAEEQILSLVGMDIYEIFFKGYTIKQWHKHPTELPPDIVKRIPIRLTLNDSYFDDTYQGIPADGYTSMVENMLSGIEVKTACDFFSDRSCFENAHRLIYTGRIDEYFESCLGPLEYRSLRFEHSIKQGDFQGVSVMNYTEEKVAHTRIIEHRHFQPHKSFDSTVVTHEYPADYADGYEAYYPVNTAINDELYQKYKQIPTKTLFAGRLGGYAYMDMDKAIAAALYQASTL